MKQSNIDCVVKSIPTKEYPTIAKRPMYSVLDKTKIIETFSFKIPDWQDALARCIKSNVR
jgi:dTDP-4-dehydrorhamnose reductase